MINWFRRVFHAAANVPERIARAALHVAEAAWHKFTDLGHLSVHAWDWMIGAAETVSRLVVRTSRVMELFARNVILVRIPQVIRWADRRLAEVADYARGLIREVTRWATRAVAELWDWAHSVPRWIFQTMGDLTGWLWDRVWPFVRDKVLRPLGRAIDAALDWARKAVAKVWDILAQAWRWITDVGVVIAHVVMGALAWLLFLAKLPFSVALAAYEFFTHLTPHGFLAYALRAFQREGSVLEEWIARWLGED